LKVSEAVRRAGTLITRVSSVQCILFENGKAVAASGLGLAVIGYLNTVDYGDILEHVGVVPPRKIKVMDAAFFLANNLGLDIEEFYEHPIEVDRENAIIDLMDNLVQVYYWSADDLAAWLEKIDL